MFGTLEDVIRNRQILINTNDLTLNLLSDVISKKDLGVIAKKKKKHEDLVEFELSRDIKPLYNSISLEYLITGKSIIMINSEHTQQFIKHHKYNRDMFTITGTYLPNSLVFLIIKKNIYYKYLRFALSIIY